MNDIAKELLNLVPPSRELLFLCIGTDRSTGDAYGPLVGSRLKASPLNLNVIGTIHEPIHAANLRGTLETIEHEHLGVFVIAIDSALGKFDDVGKIFVLNEPARPGAGVKKELPEAGDISISAVVNVSGFMEYFVLQNTRLSTVLDMVDETVKGIEEFMMARVSMCEVAAGK